jgi:glutaredoxin
MSISIYKTKTCAVCVSLAKWLTHKGRDYNEIYIDDDPKLQQFVYEKSGGFLQVPFTVIKKDGQEHYISGGNIPRIADIIN